MAYAVWLPPGYDRARAWPCIVFLNGSGECGTDGLKQTWQGLGPALLAHPERWPFVAVLPQKPSEDEEWEEREDLVFAALDGRAAETGHIDPERIALSRDLAGRARRVDDRRAPPRPLVLPGAGVRLRPRPAPWLARLAAPGVGVPGAQGRRRGPARDPGHRRRAGAAEAKEAGLPEPRLTLYPDLGHGCWVAAFGDSALPAWMLEQRRGPSRVGPPVRRGRDGGPGPTRPPPPPAVAPPRRATPPPPRPGRR